LRCHFKRCYAIVAFDFAAVERFLPRQIIAIRRASGMLTKTNIDFMLLRRLFFFLMLFRCRHSTPHATATPGRVDAAQNRE